MSCAFGHVLKNNICKAVSNLCKTFNNLTGDCTSCYPGFIIKEGECK